MSFTRIPFAIPDGWTPQIATDSHRNRYWALARGTVKVDLDLWRIACELKGEDYGAEFLQSEADAQVEEQRIEDAYFHARYAEILEGVKSITAPGAIIYTEEEPTVFDRLLNWMGLR